MATTASNIAHKLNERVRLDIFDVLSIIGILLPIM
jgi:hypothetical protein